jgi:hypothetical protein
MMAAMVEDRSGGQQWRWQMTTTVADEDGGR